jgi:hypothetical protein
VINLILFIDFLWASFQNGPVMPVYEGSSLVVRIETPLFFLGWVSSVFGIGYLLNLWHKDRKAIVAGIV